MPQLKVFANSKRDILALSFSQLKRGDLLLIAGKGHEKFQSIMGKNLPFDDVKIAKKYLQKK